MNMFFKLGILIVGTVLGATANSKTLSALEIQQTLGFCSFQPVDAQRVIDKTNLQNQSGQTAAQTNSKKTFLKVVLKGNCEFPASKANWSSEDLLKFADAELKKFKSVIQYSPDSNNQEKMNFKGNFNDQVVVVNKEVMVSKIINLEKSGSLTKISKTGMQFECKSGRVIKGDIDDARVTYQYAHIKLERTEKNTMGFDFSIEFGVTNRGWKAGLGNFLGMFDGEAAIQSAAGLKNWVVGFISDINESFAGRSID